MNTTKSQYWQMIRGICILAVVLIHCASQVRYPLTNIDTQYYFIVRNIINFPVAVFFFISGKYCKQGGITLRRICYLLIPYLIYSTIYIAAQMIFGADYTFLQVIKMYAFATASTPLYYIWVLLYYTFLTPFLQKHLNQVWLAIAIGCVCIFPMIAAYILEFNNISVWNYLKYTTIWLPFYYAGMLYRKKPVKIARSKLAFLLVIIAFIFQLVETYLMLRFQIYTIAYSQMRISGILYSSAIILFICSVEEEPNETKLVKGLTLLGNHSYGIYYLHSMFLIFLSRVLLDNLTLPLIVERVSQLIFSLGMSLITIYIIRLVFKSKHSKTIFGV